MKKPFHKHVIHHVKRAHRNVTKYLYERDTIFATIWVFLFIMILSFIPSMKFLNPVKLALKDFDFNDMAYAKLEKAEKSKFDVGDSGKIVIINIGLADREGLAMLLEKTASYEPKSIGLDVWMEEPREPEKDSILAAAIRKTPNLIIASRFKPGKGKEEAEYYHNYFTQFTGAEEGSVNFAHEELATIRLWNAYFKHQEVEYPSFALALIKKAYPDEYEKFRKKGKDKLIINYTRRTNQYQVINPDDLMMGRVDSSSIKGKIALLGYINLDPNNIEDKKFTPLNDKYYGKSVPDMNGIVVHANIVSMVLEHNYIKKLPSWFIWLFAILIGWLHMSLFIRYYLENHIWFHLVAKIAQLASAFFFVWLGVHLFDRYRIKLDMKLTLVVIVLAVDVIYFYEAWAVWMHKKFGYKTVFHHHHH